MSAAANQPSHLPRPAPGARALITGLTGQDGYYLAGYLLGVGCRVLGAAHATERPKAEALARELGPLEIHELNLEDPQSAEALIAATHPDVVYHLAAQSSVGVSWGEPVATASVNAMGTLRLLEALRRHAPGAAFVMAGSCDCFDHDAAGESGVTPESPLKATNPYAAAKIMAQELTQCYRAHWGLRASVAVLFNHTSPRRSEQFVERGIVRQAVRVSLGLAEAVEIGSRETRRDWSWAPELMEAFAALGALERPVDLVLASGRTLTVNDWINETFAQLELDSARQVRVNPARLHPGDRPHTHGNIELARERLDWTPQVGLAEMVCRLIEFDRRDLA
jgi:GDPmannose 4,6-dehydratase